jgi:hypothetical protein
VAFAACLVWLPCHADLGRLDDKTLIEALADLQLARAVYNISQKEVTGGWQRIDWRDDADGFKAAVYQRTLPDGRIDRRVVFAGTDDAGDWLSNIQQGGGWVLGFNRQRVDPLSGDPYGKAVEYARQFVAAKDKDPRMTVSLSGHSLGGALAQYCSLELGVRATVFNPAALHQKVFETARSARLNADTLISQFSLDQDGIHRFTASFPGARQFGRQYLVTTPPDLAPGLAANPIEGHGLQALELSMNRVLMRRQGSVNEPAPTPQQRAADAARADAAVSQRYAVPQEAVASWATSVSALGNALGSMQTLNALDKTRKPGSGAMFERVFGSSRASVDRGLELTRLAYDLAQAIQQDREQFRGQSVVLLRSQTLEKLAEFGLEKTLPRFFELLAEHRTPGFNAQAAQSLAGHKAGAPTFGLVDAVRAASRYGQLGHADIDTITQALDAAVGASWATLGLLASGGNLKVAEIYQQTGQAAAQSLRYSVAQLGIDKAWLRFWDREYRDQAHVITTLYKDAQYRAVLTGGKVQSPAEFFGDQYESVLKDVGFTAQHRKDLDSEHRWAASLRGHTPTTVSVGSAAQTPQQSLQDARAAARLGPAEGKVLVFGNGPVADAAYREAVARVGSGNVRQESASASRLHRSAVAFEFGANTIINVSHERYREVNAGGVRTRMDIDPVGSRNPPGSGLQRRTPSTLGPIGTPMAPPTARAPAPPPPPLAAMPSSLPKVGGVMLQGVAQSDSPGGALTAGNFSLIFQGEAGEISVPTLRRFVTAAWAVYFTNEQGPGISIDPFGPKDRHAVRYIGHVINSDLARVMRECDHLMKRWAVGDGRADLNAFLNPDEFAARNGRVHVGAPSRFWFVTDTMTYRTAGNALLLGDVRLALKTEYLQRSPGMRNPENEAFARQFTERYDEVSARYPVFEELREYAKMVALAKHLKQRGVPMLWFLLANRDLVLTEDSPGTVAAFARTSEHFKGVHIEGGVDLSTTGQASRFVHDSTLLHGLALAPAAAHGARQGAARGAPARLQVAADSTQQMTVAPAQSLAVSAPQASGDHVATDIGLRVNGAPVLELARFRREGKGSAGEFGAEWHLLVPYSVRPASTETRRYSNALVPQAMTLRNELTGREEVLGFDDKRYGVAGYLPQHAGASVNVGLFILSDGSFRLADKLGSAFHFSPAGRLTDMRLSPDYHVRYDHAEQRQSWREFDRPPYRIAPEGADRVQAAGASLPRRMRLHDALSGTEQVLEFDAADPQGRVGYRPIAASSSPPPFLAVRTDGSFVLDRGAGINVAFDPAGRFTHVGRFSLKSMRQGDYEVRFDRLLNSHGYRIRQAQVLDRRKSTELYAVNYRYDAGGELAGVQVTGSGARSSAPAHPGQR